MGKLIRCSGQVAKRPYHFHLSDIRVYSIEEVCYYIRSHIYLMRGEIFPLGFAAWLRDELGMTETAEKMERLIRDHHDIKDLVVTLCCSCDYYDETQINEMVRIMEETENLPPRSRGKLQADADLQSGHYERAAETYTAILRSDDMLQANPLEYVPIYHNIGTAYGRLGEYGKAAEAFLQAYEKGSMQESLKCYFLALHLSGKENVWEDTAERLDVPSEKREQLEVEFSEMQKKCSVAVRVRQVKKLRHLATADRLSELNDRLRQNIQDWKEEYRQEIGV